MNNIIILVDDRGFFYSSTREDGGSLDVQKLKKNLETLNYNVEVKSFYEIEFHNIYKDKIILYQSTEDPDLKYKDYIEDILLGLKNSGAILIPDFDKFRAHHNKTYMEILREIYDLNKDTNICSKKYGTIEEFKRDIEKHIFPVVIKPGAGSRSRKVYKAVNIRDAITKARKVSKTPTLTNFKRATKAFFNRKDYKPISNYRGKFIVQNYVENLRGDYKILVYADKYYILERQNRTNDFRASGSGKFSFPENPPIDLLDFSRNIFNKLRTPFASFDIALKNNQPYLIEFQFVSFGQYTLEKSLFYFKNKGGIWKKIKETSDLEKVFAESVDKYIKLYISK